MYRTTFYNNICVLLVFSLCLLLHPTIMLAIEKKSTEVPLKVIDANDWNDIFTRTSGGGWFSGDGQFSIPFNGHDYQGSARSTKTFWLFSDSRVCDSMDPVTFVVSGQKMVNHSVAVMEVLQGDDRRFEEMTYTWGNRGDYTITNIFGERLWALDGISLNNTIYMFMLQKQGKNNTGVKQIQIPIVNDDIDLWNYNKVDTLLFKVSDAAEVRIGSAVMDNTIEGGAHSPDGFIYIYGVRRRGLMKRGFMLAARVPKEHYTDFASWQYWNGSEWVYDFDALDSEDAELADFLGNRFSVTPVLSGIYEEQYILIYLTNGFKEIKYRIGDTPIGPWSDPIPLYSPLALLDEHGAENVNLYNAKAHPHLSEEHELLISFCANTFQPNENTNDKNRGRFIKIKLDERANTMPLYNVCQTPKATDASGFTSQATRHNKPFDNVHRDASKWVDDTPGDKWVSVELYQKMYISRWQVYHAGAIEIGQSAFNTRDFCLEASHDNTNWITVDTVIDNTLDITDRLIPTYGAKFWRIYITEPTQNGIDIASIYSIHLIGQTALLSEPVINEYVIGDFDSDGDVDFTDLEELVDYWLQQEPSVDIAPLPSGDGIVNFKDTALLAGHWMEGTSP